ncbi:MAG: hypothetical protein M1828_002115 [Chrysothrix sp. TS-e1954]|nr:MAG: hypothetical protein M1828_002115 [Chrysothrix sp. TS-e1954]
MATNKTLTLLSSAASPFSRKVRVALAEKGIKFQLKTEIPWDSTTETPLHNPLEKLPVLMVPPTEGGKDSQSIYESHYILDWLEIKYPAPQWPSLLPLDVDEKLLAKQVEVVSDGMCDALLQRFFERQRPEGARSKEWDARQARKVEGGVRYLANMAEKEQNGFLVGGNFTLADIAAGAALGYIGVRFPDNPWQEEYPSLAKYHNQLQKRPSFQETLPEAKTFKDKIV